MKIQRIAGFAASVVVLLVFSAPVMAVPVYCAAVSTTRNYMSVDSSQVGSRLLAGVGNIGQAAHLNPFLNNAAGAGWANVSSSFSLSFTQADNRGTRSFDSPTW